MVGSDHINLLGQSPLRGWRRPDGSPPFVDMVGAYDDALAGLAVLTAILTTTNPRTFGAPPMATVGYTALAAVSASCRTVGAFIRRSNCWCVASLPDGGLRELVLDLRRLII